VQIKKLKSLLDPLVVKYNNAEFIEHDPISIPHQFSKQQDIEISGFFAAILAWGNRKSIITSANRIIQAMDHAPYDFILNHSDNDLKGLLHIKHRTFNDTDLLYFVAWLKHHYLKENSLENAFVPYKNSNTEVSLIHFNQYFFSLPYAPKRTQKHIASPAKNSACKRLNMFLRWMVRTDENGVDFGIWKNISPANLIIPLDVHVLNSIEELMGIQNTKPNWKGAIAITEILKKLDAKDPIKYDYALFGYQVGKKL